MPRRAPRPEPRSRAPFALLLACFFLSGLAALVYQTAWTRQFTFVFGTSELAVATVLAAYMAGLALGAAGAARLVRRLRRPVLAYGLLELGIALGALAVPFALEGATGLYVALFGSGGPLPEAGGPLRALFYLLASLAILVVPTGLMGATLPFLARHAVRRESEIGSRVGTLYATNTLGAVCGTVATGFWLLPGLGLSRTIHVAVAANALVFGTALLLDRAVARSAPAGEAGDALRPSHRAGTGSPWILPFVLLSGAVAFTYEVLWTRLFGHVLGGSVYAFAAMLASFLVGIAAGSAGAARLARDPARAARGFAGAQLGIAAFALAAFRALEEVPELVGGLRALGAGSLAAEATLAAALLLPSTLCIGATFPFAVRLLARHPASAPPASARVFAWNTTGSVLGAVGAGFLVLPALGYAGTLALGAGVSLSLALGTALLAAPRRRLAAALALAGLGALLVWRPDPPWPLLRSSPFQERPAGGEVVYYGVGRSATVLLLEERASWRLTTNGLPEALIPPAGARWDAGDAPSWLGAAGSLFRPEARSLLMVGLGGGVAVEAVPEGVRRVDVVELEPEVIRANRAVAERRRHDPLADPRVRLVRNDARGALLLAERRYDLAVSQPSHPWTAGASHLYTREFFELVREHLSDDGLLVQWMGLRFADAPLLRSLVATLRAVFPHVEVFRPGRELLFFLASKAPLPEHPALAEGVADRLGLLVPEDLAAARVLDEAGARAFSEGAPLCTDDRNQLAMRSPALARRSAGQEEPAAGLGSALAPHDPLLRPTPELDRVYLVRRLLGAGFADRAERVAEATPDPTESAVASAFVQAARGDPVQAARTLDRVLASHPEAARARRARLMVARALGGDLPDAEAVPGLRASDRAVLASWRDRSRGEWRPVRAREPALAATAPRDLLYAEAQRLRVGWRLALGDAAERREALALADRLLLVSRLPAPDLLLRARAAAASGEATGALASLYDLVVLLDGERAAHRRLASEALGVLGTVSADRERLELRRALGSRLRRLARGPAPG